MLGWLLSEERYSFISGSSSSGQAVYIPSGHVFHGRFGAKLIETDSYFLEVSHFPHRNPLEPKMFVNLEDCR